MGARQLGRSAARSSTRRSTRWSRSSRAKLPETTRYAKQQLNWWRDVSWHETVGHARDWLAMSMLGDEAQGAVRRFLDR